MDWRREFWMWLLEKTDVNTWLLAILGILLYRRQRRFDSALKTGAKKTETRYELLQTRRIAALPILLASARNR